jgi:hypothetical protein
MWQLDGGASAEFSASVPVYFAITGFSQYHSQPESASVELYDVNTEMALINPGGPALDMRLFGGDGKSPFWLKEFLFLDPGDVLLARITNQSSIAQQGQIVADGYQPQFVGILPEPKPMNPAPGVPFYLQGKKT